MLKTISLIMASGATIAFIVINGNTSGGPVEFVTVPVEHGVLKDVITATGQIDSLTAVEVSSQVSGRITKVHVSYNDIVKEGQALAQIDRQSFEALLKEARADIQIGLAAVEVQQAIVDGAAVEIEVAKLEQQIHRAKVDEANAILSIAHSKLNRKRQLQTKGTVAVADVEDDERAVLIAEAHLREAEAHLATNKLRISVAQVGLARAEAELNGALASIPQRRAALQAAEVELARSTIRAPTDGVIIDRNIDAGQTVAAALEAPRLFTIAGALDQMVVHVNVDETDIGKIKVGQKALFMVDAYPERSFQGIVKEVRKSPNVFQNVVTYIVVLGTANTEYLLFPGMTALVEITIHETEPGLKVLNNAIGFQPSAVNAISTGAERATIWKLGPDGNPQPIQVELGQQDSSYRAFHSEFLQEGDQIIAREVQPSEGRGLLSFVFSK
ncbi:HlyD family secretion protein [Ruegeria atlantica]|uniref:HlyD family secretion protein n=1 Tax=Ruegeria atlantica TaxID=81569 RepID=UPI002494A5DA|nr:efflux RND transporter periplasmic adaptor subunit [Ruegeria atlantica]